MTAPSLRGWRRVAVILAWSSFVLGLSAFVAWRYFGPAPSLVIVGLASVAWLLSLLSRLAWARRSGGAS